MGPPPEGAVHEIVALALPAEAVTPVGGCGKPISTVADANDVKPEPGDEFVAYTVKLYDEPLERPVTVHDVAVVTEHAKLPGVEIT